LDTDIAGATAAGLPSLLVLTGVSTARDAVVAPADQRPTYLAGDLQSLHADAETLAVAPQPDWQADMAGATVTVTATADAGASGDGLSVVRAVASAVWDAGFGGRSLTVEPGDDTARDALRRWSLLAGIH
jgi:hypothetical protein